MNQEKQRQELASTFAHALIQSTTQKDMNLISRLNQFFFGKNYECTHSLNTDDIISKSIEMADEMANQLNSSECISDSEERKFVYLVFLKDKTLLVGCFDTERKANQYSNDSPNTIVVKTTVY